MFEFSKQYFIFYFSVSIFYYCKMKEKIQQVKEAK